MKKLGIRYATSEKIMKRFPPQSKGKTDLPQIETRVGKESHQEMLSVFLAT